MKNTTKKILSMLLAVIMLLSVMPVAYAERATYSPELEQYIEFWIKVESYRNNKYESEADREELFKIFADKSSDLEDSGLEEIPLGDTGVILYDDIYNKDIDMEAIALFNDVMQPAIDEIESKIASGEIGVGINTYEFWKLYGGMFAYYDDVLIDDMFNEIQTTNSEFYQNLKAEIDEKNYSLSPPEGFGNQTEYDAFIDNIFRPFCTRWFNCLDGNHIYGEYISNNDATEEADGTKTATCEFCGATDTVIDEGSKLVSEDNCSCNCHKSGIIGFIWKIINFFYKIFGMNKTCACGVAHY